MTAAAPGRPSPEPPLDAFLGSSGWGSTAALIGTCLD